MTLEERCAAFAAAFKKWPGAHLHVSCGSIVGTWCIGNDYRNPSRFYGAYPRSYLARVGALFPEVLETDTLHAFSGSLAPGKYFRLDLKTDAEFAGNVYDARRLIDAAGHVGKVFPLILADPAYSAADSVHYGTPSLDRRRALAALADVAPPGGHLVWLDTCWPMHKKLQWVTVGFITLIRSTNHRVRLVSIFRRTDG